jgi:two-component system chemotaxis response regulator CheY
MKPVLLVDDSATILSSMSSILKKAGFTCETAADAKVALNKISGGLTPCLVITDYHMPGMNGIELIGSLRRLGPTRFAPMLVLTTESQQEKRSEAKAAGATGWLVKPVDPDSLLKVVRQLVPGS